MVYLYLSYIKHNPNGSRKRINIYLGKTSPEDPRLKLIEIRINCGKKLALFAERDAKRLNITSRMTD